MAIRKSSDLSRMVMAEMREIGIAPEKAKLHLKQMEVLKKAQDPKVNVVVLYGGTGCGKTIVGAEVVKIWMAQHFENSQFKVQKQLNQDVSNYVYTGCLITVIRNNKFPVL